MTEQIAGTLIQKVKLNPGSTSQVGRTTCTYDSGSSATRHVSLQIFKNTGQYVATVRAAREDVTNPAKFGLTSATVKTLDNLGRGALLEVVLAQGAENVNVEWVESDAVFLLTEESLPGAGASQSQVIAAAKAIAASLT